MRTWYTVVCLLGLLASGSRAAESKPFLVVRCASIEQLGKAADQVFRGAGADKDFKDLLTRLADLFPPVALKGVDPAKPLGVYASGDGAATPLILLVPVPDADAFLKDSGATSVRDKEGNTTWLLKPGGARTVLAARFANGYAYLSFDGAESLAKQALLLPEKVLGKEGDLLALSLDLTAMPDEFRKGLAQQGRAQIDDLKARRPEESASGRRLRVELASLLGTWLDGLLEQAQSLTASLRFDGKTNRLQFDLALTPKAGSQLARQVKALSERKSAFAGLKGDHAALTARLALPLGKDGMGGLASLVGGELRDAGATKEQSETLLALLQPAVEQGTLDAVYQLRGAPGAATLLVGVAVPNGEEVAAKLKALVGKSQAAARLFQAEESPAKGIDLYRINLPRKDRPQSLAAFGDNPLFFALRKDVLVLVVGSEGRDVLKEVLALKAEGGPAAQVALAPGRLQTLLLGGKEEAEKGQGLELSVTGGTTLTIGFRTDLPSLRVLARFADWPQK